MNFVLLTPDIVERLHDAALNPGELPGRAGHKSLDGALARVDNRLAYGMIDDVFALAAAYAVAVATGHVFNDGNKRAAFRAMDFCLHANGVRIIWDAKTIGDQIIRLAQGRLAEEDFAAWLRRQV